MCVDPMTATIIAGTALQAVSSISQGIQQSETASYNADVARRPTPCRTGRPATPGP